MSSIVCLLWSVLRLGDREINRLCVASWHGKVTDDRGCDWVSIRGLCKICEGLGKDLLTIYRVH